jgi:hypothetical protein
MPEEHGEIVAYFQDGRQVEIPAEFFIINKPRFKNQAEATKWLRERDSNLESKEGIGSTFGMMLADPSDPFSKQIEDALSYSDNYLNTDKSIEEIAEEIEQWLLKKEH